MQSKQLSRVFNTTVQNHHFFSTLAFFILQLSHPYMTTGKTIALTRQTFVGKVIEENNRMGKSRDLFKKLRDTKGTLHAKMAHK